MSAEKIAAVLSALPLGRVMWIQVRGRSLSPLLRGGEQLNVSRCTATELSRGDLAVRLRGDGVLVCHLVTSTSPLITESTQGLEDPPDAEVVARVLAVKRGDRELPLAQWLKPALWAFQRAWSSGVKSPLTRGAWTLATRLLASKVSAPLRRPLLGEISVSSGAANELGVVLSRWETLSEQSLELLSRSSTAVFARNAGTVLGLAVLRADGTLAHCWLHRRAQSLGVEGRLLAALAPAKRALIHQSQRGFIEALEALGFTRQSATLGHLELQAAEPPPSPL